MMFDTDVYTNHTRCSSVCPTGCDGTDQFHVEFYNSSTTIIVACPEFARIATRRLSKVPILWDMPIEYDVPLFTSRNKIQSHLRRLHQRK